MADSADNDFLRQITAVVAENIANEQFGVTELADAMNMSRSNLLRKVKKITSLSVSQLIRDERLKRGMELLRTTSSNVSEISHQVGFSSTSYFIKCFREHYGYPPGEVGKHDAAEDTIPVPVARPQRSRTLIVGVSLLMVVAAVGLIAYFMWPETDESQLEKSIAVLPFKNDSNDSTNVYLINGLMESTLNNLQKIRDLKVISRTSVEKYRSTSKSIPEMAKELNVRYLVEGSGQKIGDQILLNIQLIEGSTDKHLWSRQYRRQAKDIFDLQREIAKNITEEIQAVITPEEKKRIEKRPTENLEAYDLYLKGGELLDWADGGDLLAAIPYFKKAIELDDKFAIAYADLAIAYYYLDIFKAEKQYTSEVSNYADKALLLDPTQAECLLAKALYFLHRKEYKQAEPYLEKALEYNPNSTLIIGYLTDYYALYNPNAGKYMEYALKGIRLDIGSKDSISTSYTYLRLGNALAQNGFIDEALKYVDKSLEYNPDNPFSGYVRAFILYAKNNDLNKTRMLLLEEFNKDTTRFDILQDIGKVSYYLRDYKGADRYYRRFMAMRKRRKLDAFKHENMTIALVMEKNGDKERARELMKDFKTFVESDQSLYREVGRAMFDFYNGNLEKGFEQMRLFSKQDDIQYWLVLFMEKDPFLDQIKDHPEFKEAMEATKERFWKNHEKLKVKLEDQGLL